MKSKIFSNKRQDKITDRIKKIINYIQEKSPNIIIINEKKILKTQLKNAKLIINSFNTFPTAAGCASSASSMACLVVVLATLFNYNEEFFGEFSAIARYYYLNLTQKRLGSGSACRSLYGGFVEWHKSLEGNSIARQISISQNSNEYADENYWKEVQVLLLIVNNKEKETSSTTGMKLCKENSKLLKVYIYFTKDKNIRSSACKTSRHEKCYY